jgi:hypothetical protein
LLLQHNIIAFQDEEIALFFISVQQV